jgi:hypothetical protein
MQPTPPSGSDFQLQLRARWFICRLRATAVALKQEVIFVTCNGSAIGDERYLKKNRINCYTQPDYA